MASAPRRRAASICSGIGLDEEADADARGLEPADGRLELAEGAGGVEAALGGDLAPVLRDEADILGKDAQGDGEDLGGVAHFEVELGDDALAQPEDVAILDVAAVGAQVDGDAAGAGPLANAGGGGEVRLDVVRLGHGGVTGLPQGGDVVDIDAEFQAWHAESQWRKWRMLVKTIAMPRSFAAWMTSLSRIEPPGWMAQVAPASAAAIRPSGKGKKASLATALPARERPASFAFQMAMREASMRDIWPAPMPRVRSFAA